MKKLILSVLTVGAMAAGGAASAQDIFGLGNVLPQILGNIGLGVGSGAGIPAVVASNGSASVYVDQYGRQIYHDPTSGQRYVLDQNGTYIDQYGRRIQVTVTQGSGVYQPGGHQSGRVAVDAYGRQIYLDQYNTYMDQFGNRMMVDSYGRHVRMDQYGSYRDQYGRTIYLGADRRPLYMEHNGQVTAFGSGTTYGGGGYAYSGRAWDRDGDGVANAQDRYPDDPRYR